MNIIKRDGTIQEYNFIKIVDAVSKAFKAVEQEVPDKFLEQVKESVEKVIIKNDSGLTPNSLTIYLTWQTQIRLEAF